MKEVEKKPKVLAYALKINGFKPGSKSAYSYDDCRYKVLATSMSDEQADVAMGMQKRVPLTALEVSENCKLDLAYVSETLDYFAWCGMVMKNFYVVDDKGVVTNEIDYSHKGTPKYYYETWVPGIFETMTNSKDNLKLHPEIADYFEEFGRIVGKTSVGKFPVGIGLMRVIPIESALDGNTKTVSSERISHYLDGSDKFSVSDCSCRTSREVMGEGCGHLKEDMCVQIGNAADYYINTGKGREITKEEAIAIFKKAEANGLMHQIPNMDGDGHTHAICNCCGCSCYALRTSAMLKNVDMTRSNYVAKVDESKCVACGECVEYCPTNAVKLGQKLCEIPSEKYQEKRTARTHDIGEDDYNYEYRTNRSYTVEDGTSPCKTACPAHLPVQAYIKLASQKRYAEALELIKFNNPFPAVCGRVCPHACEDACTRNQIDKGVAIDEIKKFIADQEMEKLSIPRIKNPEFKSFKMAVIGAGPSGLSCAYYLAEQGYSVTVFEKEDELGGMLTLGIPHFRLEKNVINKEIEVLRLLGVEFKTGQALGVDFTMADIKAEYSACYVAIGAMGARKLNLENEDADNILYGVDFCKDVNRKKLNSLQGSVLVIGGGNVAIDVARNATRITDGEVHLACLESYDEMPALDEEKEEAEAEHIKINPSLGPVKINTVDGKVASVTFRKVLSVFDENKAFNPTYSDEEVTIPCDNLIISIGQSIELGNAFADTAVTFNRNNTIKVNSFTLQSDDEFIFSGGDCMSGPKVAINAIADGKQAAISMHRSAHNGQDLYIGRVQREYQALNFDTVEFSGYDNMERTKIKHKKVDNKFGDYRETFSEEDMLKETERCLGCGASKVNAWMCVGCGMCTTRCKFDAIALDKVYEGYGVRLEEAKPFVIKNLVKREITIKKTAIKEKFLK